MQRACPRNARFSSGWISQASARGPATTRYLKVTRVSCSDTRLNDQAPAKAEMYQGPSTMSIAAAPGRL